MEKMWIECVCVTNECLCRPYIMGAVGEHGESGSSLINLRHRNNQMQLEWILDCSNLLILFLYTRITANI